MEEIFKTYRIRNKITGLYSKGGSMPYYSYVFSKKGKIWSGKGPLVLHIIQLLDVKSYGFISWTSYKEKTKEYIDNCEVIEYINITERIHEHSFTRTTTNIYPLKQLYKEYILKKLEQGGEKYDYDLRSYVKVPFVVDKDILTYLDIKNE